MSAPAETIGICNSAKHCNADKRRDWTPCLQMLRLLLVLWGNLHQLQKP